MGLVSGDFDERQFNMKMELEDLHDFLPQFHEIIVTNFWA